MLFQFYEIKISMSCYNLYFYAKIVKKNEESTSKHFSYGE